MGTDPRTQPAEEREQTSAQAPSTAITSATNLHDAVSVRCDESCTMRCRKKLYDAVSVRRHVLGAMATAREFIEKPESPKGEAG